MPTKKKARIAGRSTGSAKRRITNASVEEQIAFLESQIALLKDQTSGFRLGATKATIREKGIGDRGKGIGATSATTGKEANPPIPYSLSPIPSLNNTTTFLQTWLNEQHVMFENFAELIPQLETTELSSADRRRLNGSGVRRYGFIEKTADIAGEFPQIWPGLVDDNGKLKELVGEIEVLRNLFVWFRYLSRVVQDLLLIAGDDAFRLSGSYYAAARDGARRKNPEAAAVYDMLKLFWRKRRRTNEEPTEKEIERDFKRLMHGKADGAMAIANTELSGRSTDVPRMTGGMREVFDDVQSRVAGRNAPGARGGMKVVERGEVE